MIMNFVNYVIGVPTFSGDYAPYWINTFYMAEYTACVALLFYLVKRMMLLFDWGVKIAQFVKSRLKR